jgi:hypothetical protein
MVADEGAVGHGQQSALVTDSPTEVITTPGDPETMQRYILRQGRDVKDRVPHPCPLQGGVSRSRPRPSTEQRQITIDVDVTDVCTRTDPNCGQLRCRSVDGRLD